MNTELLNAFRPVAKEGCSQDVFSLRQPVLAEWPRRLLFVPEMRSYERQMGNVYNGQVEPHYSILSYTWGRWQLPPGEGDAINVDGISWKIPAVRPHIFTASAFASVLNLISQGFGWVWVDIACIDQEDSIIGDDEIGKQAAIFGNAEEAFIWLHHSPIVQLQSFSDTLLELANKLEGDQERIVDFGHGGVSIRWSEDTDSIPSCIFDDAWANDVLKSLEILNRDPWFSSLWTLQEAFLRGDARVLSKEGLLLERGGYERIALCSILSAWAQIDEAIRGTLRDPPEGLSPRILGTFGTIRKHMSSLGLSAGENPAVLYASAGYRKTSREEDRIYGIMQVFGFTLGKSATPGTKYSLSELEEQFANALNTRSPVWAQFFTHTKPQSQGRHWCISQSSQVPDCLAFSFIVPRAYCTISLNADSCPVFNGLECSFAQIVRLWEQARSLEQARSQPRRPNFWGSETESGDVPIELVVLDVCHFTEQYIPAALRQEYNEQSPVNQQVGNLLSKGLRHDLRLFLLGKLRVPDEELEDEDGTVENQDLSEAWIGMIVCPVPREGKVLWQRVGLAVWAYIPPINDFTMQWKEVTAMLD